MFNDLYKKLIRPIFHLRSSPHAIALGVALGMFITFTPTVGFQMLLVLAIGTLIRANRIIAVVLCWISNPLTVPPFYYGYYYLGAALLGLDAWTIGNFWKKMDAFTLALEEFGWLESIKLFRDEFLWPLVLGSLIAATAISLPCYPLTRYLLRRHREKWVALRRERRALRASGATPTPVGRRRKTPKAMLLILLLPAVVFTAACGGDRDDGGTSHAAEGFFVLAHVALAEDCSLFLEFTGLKDESVGYACLRIYNFSDSACDSEGVDRALILAAGGEDRPLRPLGDLGRPDLSGARGLLPGPSRTGEVPSRTWTRSLLAFEGAPPIPGEGEVIFAPGAEKKEGEPEGDASSKGSSPSLPAGRRQVLEYLDVPRSDWDAFIRHPTKERMKSIVTR